VNLEEYTNNSERSTVESAECTQSQSTILLTFDCDKGEFPLSALRVALSVASQN